MPVVVSHAAMLLPNAMTTTTTTTTTDNVVVIKDNGSRDYLAATRTRANTCNGAVQVLVVVMTAFVLAGVVAGKILDRIPSDLQDRGEDLQATRMMREYRRMLKQVNPQTQAAFTNVYAGRHWGHDGGGSGAGSSLHFTGPLRALLKRLVESLGIKSLVDMPSGAATWQDVFLQDLFKTKLDFKYRGVEIVKSLVDAANARWIHEPRVFFTVGDMAEEPVLSGYDAIFSRDALQHNTYLDIIKTLRNWAHSDAKYLLVGSYPSMPANHNLAGPGGNHFDIDLAKAPFNLTPWQVHLESAFTYGPGDHEKHIYVYKINDLRLVDFDAMAQRAGVGRLPPLPTSAADTSLAKSVEIATSADDADIITGVLVDTGPEVRYNMEDVMDTFVKNLPSGTNFHIVYRIGMGGEERIHAYVDKQRARPNAVRWTLDGLPKELVASRESYSRLMTNATWYRNLPGGDMILIFHTDSVACSKPKRNMREYLKYDLAAPPWPLEWNTGTAGKGGFSLRRKSAMIAHIERYEKLIPGMKEMHPPIHPEDVFFAKSDVLHYPSRHDLQEFAVEHVFSEAPLGVHQPWHALSKVGSHQRDLLTKNCPELQLVVSDPRRHVPVPRPHGMAEPAAVSQARAKRDAFVRKATGALQDAIERTRLSSRQAQTTDERGNQTFSPPVLVKHYSRAAHHHETRHEHRSSRFYRSRSRVRRRPSGR